MDSKVCITTNSPQHRLLAVLNKQISHNLSILGKVNSGLVLHPDNEHIIFPLGTTIVVRHIISRKQNFLRGHDNNISVITVSTSGKYIASG